MAESHTVELPEEDELVLTTIKKILPYGAFCILPEYKNAEAFLHISEVAPRWIKNIHEFISEGQRHVAKVYRLDRQKNQIDISLKRVSEEEKRKKLLLVRQEKRADKLFELSLSQVRGKPDAASLREKLEDRFGNLFDVFQACLDNPHALDDVDVPETLKTSIVAIAKKSLKKPLVSVRKTIALTCYSDDGVERIKKILHRSEENVVVSYLGAPRYLIALTAANYKDADRQLARLLDAIKSEAEKNKCDLGVEGS